MPGGESDHPGVIRLTRRLLWSQVVGAATRPQPVVVLLGPVGAGKTRALRSVSARCGAGIVHAGFDFDSAPEASTVEVLAQLAFDLSQEWRARPSVRFTRFTLGLIAVQAPLTDTNREADREKLRDLINEFARYRRAERVAGAVEDMLEAVGDLRRPVPFKDLLKRVLPRLIRTVGRKPLAAAKKWHADFPAADGAVPLDALLTLSRTARRHPGEVIPWLTEAFLADVRESHLRLSRPDPGSPCTCLDTDGARHRHGWLLLLDNIDRPRGSAFVRDLVEARDRHLRTHHREYDPLLVLATSGRWDPTLESRWLAPWRSPSAPAGEVRTVLPASQPDYAYWAGPGQQPVSWYFPVLLEPLARAETAAILKVGVGSPLCAFAERATGGLPGAVHHLAAYLADRQFAPGARNVLASGAGQGATRGPCCLEVLDRVRLTEGITDLDIEEFIGAAPFATAPWLVPQDAASLISRPSVGRILTELRSALWVSFRGHRGTESDPQLHPWIGRALVAALVGRNAASGCSYAEQFAALLADSAGDPVREAYCRLALGEIDRVVALFGDTFAAWPHKEWVDRLNLVVSAPDRLPLESTSVELYDHLVGAAHRAAPADAWTNTVTRLVAASWLAANPFAMPDPALSRIIEHSYRDLAPMSPRADVAALHLAAEQAVHHR